MKSKMTQMKQHKKIKLINNKISSIQNHSDQVDKMALIKVELRNHIQATKDNTYHDNNPILQKKRQVKKNYIT